MVRSICLCGLKGSGKSTIAEILETEYDFKRIELSKIVRGLMANKMINEDRIVEFSLELRKKFGETYLSRLASKEVPVDAELVVFDGVRSLNDLEELSKLGQLITVGVFVPKEMRYARLLRRGRSSDPCTTDGLIDMDRVSLTFGLGEILTLVDYMVINNGTLLDLKNTMLQLVSVMFDNRGGKHGRTIVEIGNQN